MAAPEEAADAESYRETYRGMMELAATFPRVSWPAPGWPLYRHLSTGWLAGIESMAGGLVAQSHLVARPSDVIVASFPKSGTTWLKAVVFAVTARGREGPEAVEAALGRYNPHECVPFLEMNLYTRDRDRMAEIEDLPPPRLFGTHMLFQMLPASVAASRCKILHIRRDAKDVAVSMCHFLNKLLASKGEPATVRVEEVVEYLCTYEPFWDNVVSYWEALQKGHPVLMLEYEKMAQEQAGHVRRIAEFLGCPFSPEEESNGTVEGIVDLCGFESLSKVDANREGRSVILSGTAYDNGSFFRRGVAGDWANYLSPEMAQRIDHVTEKRFRGSGLIS